MKNRSVFISFFYSLETAFVCYPSSFVKSKVYNNKHTALSKIVIFTAIILLGACTSPQTHSLSILELTDMDYRFSTSNLIDFCHDNKIDANSVYQWQNHWLIYGAKDVSTLALKLEEKFPRLKVNIYKTPFYSFRLQDQCNQEPAKDWTNIIMTANLVADTAKQKEYMEYHRTQFEKWPEVSKGFCNASFQQLLVFRTGRQLMLVISIPKGKTLDELNPKTTENNPRVNEWNKIMANYQEGIEDAPKGSTWVMFKSLR